MSGGNVGRLDHGLGLQLTEPPSQMPGDRTVLEPGIVVRETGTELLTPRAPREMAQLR